MLRARIDERSGQLSDTKSFTPLHSHRIILTVSFTLGLTLNPIFRLVRPVYDMDTYIFKVHVFTKQAKSE